jgi:hypothetical protein
MLLSARYGEWFARALECARHGELEHIAISVFHATTVLVIADRRSRT